MFWVLLGFFFLAVLTHLGCYLLGGNHRFEAGRKLGFAQGQKEGFKRGLQLGDSARERAVSEELTRLRVVPQRQDSTGGYNQCGRCGTTYPAYTSHSCAIDPNYRVR